MKRLDKQGEEYVEAAIVMPLLILTILSMILIAVFLFGHLESKSESHIALMHEVAASGSVFGIKKGGVSSSSFIRGILAKTEARNDSMRAYTLKPAEAVRTGGLFE